MPRRAPPTSAGQAGARAMGRGHHGIDLLPAITLLAVAVVAAPVFKRLDSGAAPG